MATIPDKMFYGNSILEWLTAFGIIILALVVGKLIYWICKNVVRALTEKTETKLDDLIVDMIEEPVVFAVTVGGVWFGLMQLHFADGAREFIDRGVEFLLVISVTWFVARLLDAIFQNYLAPLAAKSETDLDDHLLPIVRKGSNAAIWSIGLIVGLNNAGYDVGALLAGLGIGGLALAMAAKDTVSNIFGGFTIFTDQPFKLNDRVKVAGFDGVVREIGLRSTRLETLEGRIVTIPNSTFADSPVENVSREPSRKVVMNLGLTYDTSSEKMEEAMAILRSIAQEHTSTEEDVRVAFDQFGDSAMNILCIYFVRNGEDILATQTAVNMAILRRFTEASLEFAYPTQTIYSKRVEN